MSKKASQNKQVEGRDPESGRFLAGNGGNGGRKPGSRNKLCEAFIADLHSRWMTDGPQVLDAVIKDKPHEFLKVIARLLPQQFDETVNLNVSVLAEIKDFVECYRYALGVIGSNKSPKLINGHGRSD
jgi:hypothetical protein